MCESERLILLYDSDRCSYRLPVLLSNEEKSLVAFTPVYFHLFGMAWRGRVRAQGKFPPSLLYLTACKDFR